MSIPRSSGHGDLAGLHFYSEPMPPNCRTVGSLSSVIASSDRFPIPYAALHHERRLQLSVPQPRFLPERCALVAISEHISQRYPAVQALRVSSRATLDDRAPDFLGRGEAQSEKGLTEGTAECDDDTGDYRKNAVSGHVNPEPSPLAPASLHGLEFRKDLRTNDAENGRHRTESDHRQPAAHRCDVHFPLPQVSRQVINVSPRHHDADRQAFQPSVARSPRASAADWVRLIAWESGSAWRWASRHAEPSRR